MVFTIGHGTRTTEELVALLERNRVEELWDIRSLPGSRRYPHFNREALEASIPAAGIEYRHVPGLGGRRRGPAGHASPNLGWRNLSFRNYADYMQTDDFEVALSELVEHQSGRRVAIMCSEAVPWRCHRNLVADALVARGVEVLEIISEAARLLAEPSSPPSRE